MPVDLLERSIGIGLPLIFGFLLTLARIGGLVVFLPIPMMRSAPEVAKVVLTLALTMAMFPFWPRPVFAPEDLSTPLLWMLAEAALGCGLGLILSFAAESISIAMQMIATQAGYSYATSIDPNSAADSGVLPVMGQMIASLLFFSLGLDGRLIGLLAVSLQTLPPGEPLTILRGVSPEATIQLGSDALLTGVRLAMPTAALLLILDIALALVGRINQQLQLLFLAFPVKMLLCLTMLAALAPVIAKVYATQAAQAFRVAERMLR